MNKLFALSGYKISRLPKPAAEPVAKSADHPQPAPAKPNPKDYSTTTEPMEVPCQKEAYYYALNHHIKPGDKVLDVGCGLGYGMHILSVKAAEVQGVDVDKKAVAHVRRELLGRNPKIKQVQAYDGKKLPFGDQVFDVVTCVDVVEHVEDYDAFIDELLRVSKKIVMFSTPNRRPEFTNPDGTPRNYWHLREWSHSELDTILAAHPAKVKWLFIAGPWDGPFKIEPKAGKDTLVLMPTLYKK